MRAGACAGAACGGVRVLTRVSGAQNILDDVELITTLESAKITSNEIKQKMMEAEETEKEIDESRESYRPVARRAGG